MKIRYPLVIVIAAVFVCIMYIADGTEAAGENSGICGDDLNWNISGTTLVISGSGDMYDYQQGSSPWYEHAENVSTILFEGCICSIGDFAFYDFESLSDIVIPTTVTHIGTNAFVNCNSLSSLAIPDSVTTLEENSFSNCFNLTELTMPIGLSVISPDSYSFQIYINLNSLHRIVFTGSDGLSYGGVEGTTTIQQRYMGTPWYLSRATLEEIVITESVKSIGYPMFSKISIHKLTIPVNIPLFSPMNDRFPAFYQCTVSDLTITGTGGSADYDEEGLYNWNSQRMDGYYCNSLPWYNNLKSLIISDGVTHLGNNIFKNCPNLETLSIPISVSLSSTSFSECTSLQAVHFTCGSGVGVSCSEWYSYSPWYISANSITTVTFDEGITNIGDYLIKKSIPNVTVLIIPESVASIGVSALNFPGVTKLTVPFSTLWQSGNANNFNEDIILEITVGTGIGAEYTSESYANSIFNRCRSSIIQLDLPLGITQIGAYTFYNNTAIETLTLPSTLTSIGAHAFEGCSKIEGTIALPNNVTSLNTASFKGCSSITGLVIPVSLNPYYSHDENAAFSGCTNLRYFELTPGTGTPFNYTTYGIGTANTYNYTPWYFHQSEGIEVVIQDGITSLGTNTFYKCTKITKLTIPVDLSATHFIDCTGLTELHLSSGINGMAVNYTSSNYNLTPWYSSRSNTITVTIDDNVKNIGAYSFQNCTGLQSINLPSATTSVGEHAFYGCTNVNFDTANISRLTSIGNYAFYNCEQISGSLTFSNSLSTIGTGVFYNCSRLTGSLSIPASVANIGNEAFYGCSGLTGTLTVPSSVTSLGTGVFQSTSFTSVSFPAGLALSENILRGNTSLVSITLPSDLTNVPAYAFEGCISLILPSLPSSLKTVGAHAFENCSHMVGVLEFPNGATSVGANSFKGCVGLTGLILPISMNPYGSTGTSAAFIGCSDLRFFRFTPGTGTPIDYTSQGFNTASTYTVTPWYFHREDNIEIVIDDGITSLGTMMFSGCTGIAKLTMPVDLVSSRLSDCTGLTELHLTAGINGSGVTYTSSNYNATPWYKSRSNTITVVIEDGVKSVGAYTFNNNIGIGEVVLPNSLMAIGDHAFAGCNSLTRIDLPDALQTISNNAFYQTSLVAIKIPAGVKSISDYAFTVASLTEVIFDQGISATPSSLAFSNQFYDSDKSTTPLSGVNEFKGKLFRLNDSGTKFVYACKLTVNYYYSDGSSAPNQYETTIISGQSYSVKSPSVIGYVPDIQEISGTMGTSDLALEVMYSPQTFQVTFDYGRSEIPPSTIIQTYNSNYVLPENPPLGFAGWFSADGSVKVTAITSVKITEDSTFYAHWNKAGDSLYWGVVNGTQLVLEGEGRMDSHPWQDYYDVVTIVSLPEGLTTISEYAFSQFSKITEIDIPDSVERIGMRAFYGCSSLTELTIPRNAIAAHLMVEGCKSLSVVNYNSERSEEVNYDCVFYGTGSNGISLIFGDNVTSIPDKLCYCSDNESYYSRYCNITSVSIGANVKTIGSYAFYHCKLTSVIIPDNVETIGDSAFYDCGLKEITIGKGVTSLGYASIQCNGVINYNAIACSDCSENLGCIVYSYVPIELNIGDEVSRIPAYFAVKAKFSQISFGNSLEEISNHAFDSATISSIHLPHSVNIVGEKAFYACKSLTSIILDNPDIQLQSDAMTLVQNCNIICSEKVNIEQFEKSGYHFTRLHYELDKPSTNPDTFSFTGEEQSYFDESVYPNLTFSNNTQVDAGSYLVSVSIYDKGFYCWSDGTQDILEFEFVIRAINITVIANDVSIVYGSTPSFGFTVEESSVDISSYVSYSCDYIPGSNVGTYTIMPVVTTSNVNASCVTGTLTVAKKTINLFAQSISVTYGDDAPQYPVIIDSMFPGDTFSDYHISCSYASGTPVSSSGLTIEITGPSESDNYIFIYHSGLLTIQKREVTVRAESFSITYGSEVPSYEHSVTGDYVGSPFKDYQINCDYYKGADCIDGGYPIAVAGPASTSNYNLTYISGILTVLRIPVTITAESKTVTYGDELPELTATVSGGEGDYSNTYHIACTYYKGAAVVNEGYPITITGPDYVTNYEFHYVDAVLKVNKKPISIHIDNSTITYGTDAVFTSSILGLIAGDTLSVSYKCDYVLGSDASEYEISAETDYLNYSASVSDGILSVIKKQLIVKAEDIQVTYGEEPPIYSVSMSGLVIGDVFEDYTLECSYQKNAPVNAQGYEIIVSGPNELTNYSVEYHNGVLNVLKKTLVVQPLDTTVVYGSDLPNLEYKIIGTEDTLILDVNYDCAYRAGSPVTATGYVIGLSGPLETDNYLLTYKEGLLSVTKKNVTLSVNSLTRHYGDEAPEYTITNEGLCGDDSIVDYSIECSYVKGANPGSYIINVSGPSSNTNYQITYQSGILTITDRIVVDGFAYTIQKTFTEVILTESSGVDVVIPSTIIADEKTYSVIGFTDNSLNPLLQHLSLGDHVIGLSSEELAIYVQLKTITISKANTNYSSLDGVLFDKTQKILIKCPDNYQLTNYIIPDSVTRLDPYAFEGCVNLQNVVLGKNVSNVGPQPFHGCKNLIHIGVSADNYHYNSAYGALCDNLSLIRCPEGFDGRLDLKDNPAIISIGDYAFRDCNKLTQVDFGNRVTTIGYNIFEGCDSLNIICAYTLSGTYQTGISFDGTVRAFTDGATIQGVDGTLIENIQCSKYDVSINSDTVSIAYLPDTAGSVDITDSILHTYYGLSKIPVDEVVLDLGGYNSIKSIGIQDKTIVIVAEETVYSITFNYYSGDSLTLSYGIKKKLSGDIPDPYVGVPAGCIAYWDEYSLDMSESKTVNLIVLSYLDYEEHAIGASSGVLMAPIGQSVWVTGVNNNITAWYNHLGSEKTIEIPQYTLDGRLVNGIKSIIDDTASKISFGRNIRDIAQDAFNNCIALQSIIAIDNSRFSSSNGALLSDDGKILYAIPYSSGSVFNVPDSVEVIHAGAITGDTKTLCFNSVRDIEVQNGANISGHAIRLEVAKGSNIASFSNSVLLSGNDSMNLSMTQAHDEFGKNLGSSGNYAELVILAICVVMIFYTIIAMEKRGAAPEQKNLYITVGIATIADFSVMMYLLLCSQAAVSEIFTYIWMVSIVAVLLEIVSTYSLYMFQLKTGENRTTFGKMGRILTYCGESIGLISSIVILYEFVLDNAPISDTLYTVVILIVVLYMMVESLVMSTIYKAFANTKDQMVYSKV